MEILGHTSQTNPSFFVNYLSQIKRKSDHYERFDEWWNWIKINISFSGSNTFFAF